MVQIGNALETASRMMPDAVDAAAAHGENLRVALHGRLNSGGLDRVLRLRSTLEVDYGVSFKFTRIHKGCIDVGCVVEHVESLERLRLLIEAHELDEIAYRYKIMFICFSLKGEEFKYFYDISDSFLN